MPLPLLALGLLGASLGLRAKGEYDVEKRQARIQQALEAFQRKKSAESMAATEHLMSTMGPEQRAAQVAGAETERRAGLEDTVGRLQVFNPPDLPGRPSADYDRAREASANDVSARTRRAIEQLAIIGAPGEAGFQGKIRFGRAAGDVDAANTASANVSQAYLNDIRGVKPKWQQRVAADALGIFGVAGAGR